MSMGKKNDTYYQQFEPASESFEQAKDLVLFCLQHGLRINLEDYSDDFKTDLLIVKCMELARFKSKG